MSNKENIEFTITIDEIIIIENFNIDADRIRKKFESTELTVIDDRHNSIADFIKSLDIIQSYTTSLNYSIPFTFIIDYISKLEHLKDLFENIHSDDLDIKKAFSNLYNTSLPLKLLMNTHFKITDNELIINLKEQSQFYLKQNLEASNNARHLIREEKEKAIEQFNTGVNVEIEAIRKRIDLEVNHFSSKQKTIDDYFEKLGIVKEGEAYLNQATKEEKSANQLRLYGMIFLFSAIGLLGFLFKDYLGLGEDLTPEYVTQLQALGSEIFALRFLSVILLTTPAIYLLKESASHRTKENLYRQRGTQIISMPSYMEGLSDEDKTKLKLELASSFFSFHDGKADTQNVPDFIRDMKEAVSIAKSINSSTPRKKSTILGKGSK